MRPLLLPLAALLLAVLLVAAAREARAEEVFVLDNGAVLRGYVIRETEDGVVVRLAGFPGEARVTVESARIVRRFVTVAQSEQPGDGTSPFTDWSAAAQTREEPLTSWSPHRAPLLELPTEEPGLRSEGFFHRLARVAVLATPKDTPGRMLLGLLLFVALLALVTLSGRVAEAEAMGLPHATVLSILLGGFLILDVFLHQHVLRADRAIWVLPLQGFIWLVAAWNILRGGFQRALLVFAFVLFSLAVLVFTAGAILISF